MKCITYFPGPRYLRTYQKLDMVKVKRLKMVQDRDVSEQIKRSALTIPYSVNNCYDIELHHAVIF